VERIAGVFEKGNFGFVSHIDLVENKNGGEYNAAYIHFKEWFDTTMTRSFQERVLDHAKDARVVYDDPWFWIVLENKSAKRESKPIPPAQDKNDFTKVPHRHQYVANVAELVAKYNPAARAQIQARENYEDSEKEPCMNLVSSDYAAKLEGEIYRLRTENARLEKRTLVLELKLAGGGSGNDEREDGEEEKGESTV